MNVIPTELNEEHEGMQQDEEEEELQRFDESLVCPFVPTPSGNVTKATFNTLFKTLAALKKDQEDETLVAEEFHKMSTLSGKRKRDFAMVSEGLVESAGISYDDDESEMGSDYGLEESGGEEDVSPPSTPLQQMEQQPPAQASPPSPFFLRREEKPFNEFLRNNELLLWSFPYLFLRGEGVKPGTGSLHARHVKHLLRQHDGRFATDCKFLFTLFNQKQRHAVCRKVKARGRRGVDGTFDALIQTINDEGFEKKLDAALADPQNPESKKLVAQMQRLVKTGSMKIPFSAAERKSAGSEIYSMILLFGKLLMLSLLLLHFK